MCVRQIDKMTRLDNMTLFIRRVQAHKCSNLKHSHIRTTNFRPSLSVQFVAAVFPLRHLPCSQQQSLWPLLLIRIFPLNKCKVHNVFYADIYE